MAWPPLDQPQTQYKKPTHPGPVKRQPEKTGWRLILLDDLNKPSSQRFLTAAWLVKLG
jgi:hypothetical protein